MSSRIICQFTTLPCHLAYYSRVYYLFCYCSVLNVTLFLFSVCIVGLHQWMWSFLWCRPLCDMFRGPLIWNIHEASSIVISLLRSCIYVILLRWFNSEWWIGRRARSPSVCSWNWARARFPIHFRFEYGLSISGLRFAKKSIVYDFW